MKVIDIERRKTGVFIKAIDRKLAKTLVRILAELLDAAQYLVSSVPEPGQRQKDRAIVKQKLKEYDQRALAVYSRFLFHLEHDYEMTRDEAKKKMREELGLSAVDLGHYLTRGRQIEKEQETKRQTQLARREALKPKKKPRHSKRWHRLHPSKNRLGRMLEEMAEMTKKAESRVITCPR